MTNLAAKIFVAILLLLALPGMCRAQFIKADIGINGLTCSQCSRSVEIELKKLEFVQSVAMDLEHTQGTIIFREKTKVNIAAIAKAVKNAGFSVRYLKAALGTEQAKVDGQCFKYRGDAYNLLKPSEAGIVTLQFIGKEYMPAKELKQYKLPAKTTCKGTKVYYADVL